MNASDKQPTAKTPADPVQDSIEALRARARSFVPVGKVDQLARQWLPPGRTEAARQDLALRLANELALSITSLLGATPFDRLARATTPDSPQQAQALAALRQARFHLLQRKSGHWIDAATGQAVPIAGVTPMITDSEHCLVRLAPFPDGAFRVAGEAVGLDDAARAVALGFMRPDRRGLTNPTRCTEAVFRHIVRHARIEPPSPFHPDTNPLDRIAAAWADLGREPLAEERMLVRPITSQGEMFAAMRAVSFARDLGQPRLAAAYTSIARVMMESLALRATNGSTSGGIDAMSADLDIAIARGLVPPETRALFDSLRLRVEIRPAAGAGGNPDVDKLIQRIQGLRAKTVERGCTEQEALAAAEKVAELLDRHGLSMSELDMRRQACEGVGITTDRKRRAPIDDCVGMIGVFFDCRLWGETRSDGMLHYVFFGMPADVQAALYLYDLVALAFTSETAAFQNGAAYRKTDSSQRRTMTTSFQVGLARGINAKLSALRDARTGAIRQGPGRDLVPIKASIVDEELARLGLTLRTKSAARRMVRSDAFEAGKEAGERFEYRQGIAGGRSNDR